MRIMRTGILILFIILVFSTLLVGCKTKNSNFKSGTVRFKSLDEVTVTGDLYIAHGESAPFILLCHQAGYSRGEYLETAPKLNALGFNCMAIDQRSGTFVKGVENETAKSFNELKKVRATYVDALPDIEAAVAYIKNELKIDKIIILGSSYSASLAFIIAEKYPDTISGVISLSPGEYFTFDDKKVEDYASSVTVPVFLTSTKTEVYQCTPIFDRIPSLTKTYYLPEEQGFHGSSALWEMREGNEKYWAALKEFLEIYTKR